jgi:hypothetical protein
MLQNLKRFECPVSPKIQNTQSKFCVWVFLLGTFSNYSNGSANSSSRTSVPRVTWHSPVSSPHVSHGATVHGIRRSVSCPRSRSSRPRRDSASCLILSVEPPSLTSVPTRSQALGGWGAPGRALLCSVTLAARFPLGWHRAIAGSGSQGHAAVLEIAPVPVPGHGFTVEFVN